MQDDDFTISRHEWETLVQRVADLEKAHTQQEHSKEVAEIDKAGKAKSLTHTRGTRLPEDYVPPNEKITQMMNELRCSKGALVREHRRFCDYFLSVSGQKGVKINWDRAWCNWMRGAAERGTLHSDAVRPNDNKIRELMEMDVRGSQ